MSWAPTGDYLATGKPLPTGFISCPDTPPVALCLERIAFDTDDLWRPICSGPA
jgi:hypothetical protein